MVNWYFNLNQSLCFLNRLVIKGITDEGVKALAEAIKLNTSLQHIE